jgi:hypothetical protein
MLIFKGTLLGFGLAILSLILYYAFLYLRFGGAGMFDLSFFWRMATLFFGLSLGILAMGGVLIWINGALTKHIASLRP